MSWNLNISPEKATAVQNQIRETVQQEKSGIKVRTATITCGCGQKRAVVLMFQCLYCKEWYCTLCAEQHFGKTIKDFHADKNFSEGTEC